MSEENKISEHHKKVKEAWGDYSDAKTKIKNSLEKWAEHLGIDGIVITSDQEYDDNNYYMRYTLDSFMGVDCCLEYHHMDDEFARSLEAFTESIPPNSFKFITDRDKTKTPLPIQIEELKEEHDETHIDVCVAIATAGIDLDEAYQFLNELLDVNEDTCPDAWNKTL